MPAGRRIEISGTVQGVGFRPWIYRLARSAGLTGTVRNDARGVTIEAFGSDPSIDDFLRRIETEPPPAAAIQTLRWAMISTPRVPEGFLIMESDGAGDRRLSIPPDLATCDDCRREIRDPGDRRYRYAFTNCTHCGPRFTIVQDLPYDRPQTTMSGFTMCPACRAEYEDPGDRRFHAQPNACPDCGPQLELRDGTGRLTAERDEALRQAAQALADGRIVAAKGLGGFHLLADCRNREAVALLRRRKGRPTKPLAILAPDLEWAGRLGQLADGAEEALLSPAAPIVLLPRRPEAAMVPEVCAESPYCGVMLPSTPLHHLLLADLGFPLVATSGNLSDEPIAFDDREARERLGRIADLFLGHDRPITRHADDSIVWLAADGTRLLRRARGEAPRPLELPWEPPTLLAVGAHLKNVVALTRGDQVFLSQHIGDMETPQAIDAFERVIRDYLRIFQLSPRAVAHDLHPDYASTRWARTAAAAADGDEPPLLVGVQHHHAHLASCLLDNRVAGPALGIIWDGTGYGPDGTVWGGEFLLGDAGGYRRVAHLRPFRLPGGEAAVREPRRSALALLWDLLGEEAFERRHLPPVRDLSAASRKVLAGMLARSFGSPVTTSAGRLFDAVASLAGLHQRTRFEGEAAVALEKIADPDEQRPYPLPLAEGDEPWQLDWRPLVAAILEDRSRGVEPAVMAARFHRALAAAIVAVAQRAGTEAVALSGGCFQNRLLTELAVDALRKEGFHPLLHRRVPANDGGISFGQVAVAAARLETTED